MGNFNNLVLAKVFCKDSTKNFVRSLCDLTLLKENGRFQTAEYMQAFELAKTELKTLRKEYYAATEDKEQFRPGRDLGLNSSDIQSLVNAMDMVAA